MSMTIGITTFSKRFDMLVTLVSQLRRLTKDKIIICINGEQNGKFDNEYRKKVLQLCAQNDDVYPIFFIEIRGLSKLWNTIVNTSNTNNVLMLNDDLELTSDILFYQLQEYLNSGHFKGLTKINNSFSHFLISKEHLNKIGYFDERLLGFGEEDGDITYRFLKNNLTIDNININGFSNLVSEIRHDEVKSGIGKYSKFNRDYIYNKKYYPDTSSEIKGMFDNCYPLERYYLDNKKDL
jgi:hypothetical protein